MEKKYFIVGVGILVVCLAIYLYFFVLSPGLVSKPYLEKPGAINSGDAIKPEHIQWIVNEIGAYKLHNSPISNDAPVMQIIVDDNQSFIARVNNNIPQVSEAAGQNVSQDVDLILRTDRLAVIEIFSAQDILAKIKELTIAGRVAIEPLKDTQTLALKGYKGIYDTLSN